MNTTFTIRRTPLGDKEHIRIDPDGSIEILKIEKSRTNLIKELITNAVGIDKKLLSDLMEILLK